MFNSYTQVAPQIQTNISQQITGHKTSTLKKIGVTVYNHKITDLHTYDFYVEELYNTDECRCGDENLYKIQGGRWYEKILIYSHRFFYNMIGFFALNTQYTDTRIRRTRWTLFIMFILQPIFIVFQVSVLRHICLAILLVYIILGFPALFMRAKAVWIYNLNDNIVPHASQMNKVIFVKEIEGNVNNQFYELTTEEFQVMQQNLDARVTTDQFQLLVQSTMRITGRSENKIKFMLMTHEFHSQINDVFDGISSIFHYRIWIFVVALGLQVFYLVLFIQHS